MAVLVVVDEEEEDMEEGAGMEAVAEAMVEEVATMAVVSPL